MYLRKAFDTVDHEILLEKLCGYGMGAIELVCFKDYLSNRTHVVGHQSFFSHPCAPRPGVARVSMLGPLLFVSFIIHLPDAVSHCSILLIAFSLY